jgi:hypothetical protein
MAGKADSTSQPADSGKLLPAQDLATGRLALQAAVEQLRDDVKAGQSQLAQDKSAIATERQAALRQSPEFAQWKADLADARRKLQADRHRVTLAAKADVNELIAGFEQIQASSPDAVSRAVDRAKLVYHPSHVSHPSHEDVYSAVERLLNDQTAIHQLIHYDKAAIRSTLESHPGYSAAMAALKRNRSAFQARVTADRAILHAAIRRFRRDEAAAARNHAPAVCGDGEIFNHEWKPYFG